MFWYDASLAFLFLPPNQPPSLFSNSSPSSHIPLPPSLPSIFMCLSRSVFIPSLPPCSQHCVAVIWHWAAAAGTTHSPPLQRHKSNHMGPKEKKKKKLLYRCGTEQQHQLYSKISETLVIWCFTCSSPQLCEHLSPSSSLFWLYDGK